MTLDNSPAPRLDRRDFLKAGAPMGGGLALTEALPPVLRPAPAADALPAFASNAFIHIDREGAATLVMPMAEIGQGTYTSLTMLLAEELEVGLDQVGVEHAPPGDALYANSILHVQTTGLSSSVRAFWMPLRQAGAVARTMLVAAAARQAMERRPSHPPAVAWRRLGRGWRPSSDARAGAVVRPDATAKRPAEFGSSARGPCSGRHRRILAQQSDRPTDSLTFRHATPGDVGSGGYPCGS